jgi:uncharacterized SAM-binding protein YcdF (DUF218 family)
VKTLAAIVIVLLAWTAGLFAFASRVERSTPAEEPPVADAVVALTGASDLRIETGVNLLAQGRGRRLLVSGVHPDVTRADLQAVAHASSRLYNCCVDLGFDATDTLGNAQETAAWARAKSFGSLVVVTSDYHMPRALLELRGALPEAELYAYPVVTPSLDARRWWRTSSGARFMTLEYCKYLVVLARESVLALGRRLDRTEAAETVKQAVPDAVIDDAASGLRKKTS